MEYQELSAIEDNLIGEEAADQSRFYSMACDEVNIDEDDMIMGGVIQHHPMPSESPMKTSNQILNQQ